jgi:hypothetical protein
MKFSTPELTKIIAIRIRPMARIAIVHSGRSANIGMHQVASHGVHAHRNVPAMDPLENAAALRSVPERPHRAICTIWPRNLYSAVGGITLWHVIRSRGAVAVRVLACPLVLSGDVSYATSDASLPLCSPHSITAR